MTRNRCLILLGAFLVAVCVWWRPAAPPRDRSLAETADKGDSSDSDSISGVGSVARPDLTESPDPPVLTGPLPAPNPPSRNRPKSATAAPRTGPGSAGAEPLAEPLAAPAAPQLEVESLALNIRQYQLRFGGNPVGNNAEIIRELNGGNPKGAEYLPSGLKRFNEQGELLDTWGTPYFFHQESAEQMEIRSAGPDAVMWTDDDLVAR